jgi:integrase
MRIKLTEKELERLKAPTQSGKQEVAWDTEVKGFGLLLSGKTSAKTYIVQRELPGGRTRRVTIGSIGELKLAKAREEAKDVIHAMRKGEDPKRKVTGHITLQKALETYLRARSDLRPKSVTQYRASIETYLAPWLNLPLREIDREMVEERHKAIADGVAKRGRYKGKAVANATMRSLRVLWNYAADRDPNIGANPVRLRRQWFDVPSRTRLIKGDELPAFYAGVMALPNPVQRDYLCFLLFTGLRREEAAMLEWEHVDIAGRIIRVPATSTKPRRKLDLPMTTFVRDLLIARQAAGRERFVFPAYSASGHIEEPKFALGLVAGATGIRVSAHDLRRTFITIAESSDISPLALKALVNHSLGRKDVTSSYVQMTADRLREPAQRVCDKLVELCKIPELEGVEQVA